MIHIKRLLQLQLLYYAIAILFNIVSISIIHNGGMALTPNEPVQGCWAMSLYALFLIPGFMKKYTIYRILMLLAVILLGYGGVFNHVNMIQNTPELYYSVTAGVIGASINVFGLILNIIALSGRYQTN